MISGLFGRIVRMDQQTVEICVTAGLVYEIAWASRHTDMLIPETEVRIWTHLVVREDQWTLYGFASVADRQFFRELIRLTGVGPKMAQGVVVSVDPQTFSQWVLEKNTRALSGLPGIGKKTAERIAMELRDRMPLDGAGTVAPVVPRARPVAKTQHIQDGQHWEDALSAMQALGYPADEAIRALLQVEAVMPSADALLKAALQHCGTRKGAWV